MEIDKKKADYYYKLAAIRGELNARCNLGNNEKKAGNMNRALKHYMIAVRGGCTHSVKAIQRMFMNGHVSKDQYANALQCHQAYINEIKSDQRDKAAAFSDDYRYY